MFTVRMDEPQIQHLKEVAKAYGASSAAEFVRRMFNAMLSADVGERLNYVHSLAMKLGGQLALPIYPVDTPATGNAEQTPKRKKKRRARDRTT